MLSACTPSNDPPPPPTAEPAIVGTYWTALGAGDVEGARQNATLLSRDGEWLTGSDIPAECISGEAALLLGEDPDQVRRLIDTLELEGIDTGDGGPLKSATLAVITFEYPSGATWQRGLQWVEDAWRIEISPDSCGAEWP